MEPSVRPPKDRAILRQYYLEKHLFASAEGVLKVLSIVSCASLSALWASAGCRAGAAGAGGAAALQCALCAALGGLAARAPRVFFYTDVSWSCVSGGVLLCAALLVGLAPPHSPLLYVCMLLAVVSASLVLISAVTTYLSVIKRLDAAHTPTPEPPKRQDTELEA